MLSVSGLRWTQAQVLRGHGARQAPHFVREIVTNITLPQGHGSKQLAVLVAPFFSKCVHSLNQKEGKPNQPLDYGVIDGQAMKPC
jgi:hypothetical protein